MNRIIIHWTAGQYAPNTTDLEHYHFVVGGNGKVHKGKFEPEDNINCNDGRYAQHTGGGNTRTIGIAMACMYGFMNERNQGEYPMTNVQFESCMKEVAKLCKRYNILISPETVLTHYEFGQKHPKTTSYGKPDIVFIPPYSHIKRDKVGDFIRKKVKWYLSKYYF
ncbi:MAG: N-acetylmuramoyl-L-alanine amidase [bacterium]|nr:N-acetylmuramoyl-L-alanine amidase [bacterium]